MGLETWYYKPPLPPFHEIDPPAEAVAPLLLGAESRDALVEGVEVYARHRGGPGFSAVAAVRSRPFERSRVVVSGRFAADPRPAAIVGRNRGGGTFSMSPSAADVILAELVDAGLLGPGCVMDWNQPVQCTRCKADVPRTSPTGQCADQAACKGRRDAVIDAGYRAAWDRFVAREADRRGPHRLATEEHDAITWAARELDRLRRVEDATLAALKEAVRSAPKGNIGEITVDNKN